MLKVINYDDVMTYFSFKEAIQVMKKCFRDFQKSQISQADSEVLVLPDVTEQNNFAIKSAYLGRDRLFGAKLSTMFPDVAQPNFISHLGTILLFDSTNGDPQALVDALAITRIRTAAVSALATDYLAKKSATSLALIGTGQQASSHLAAIACVRQLETVYVYDVLLEKSQPFAEKMRKKYPQLTIEVTNCVETAVSQAEIICTLTSSKTPIVQKEWIQQGTHLNAIGALSATTREISSELMAEAAVFVDDYEAALQESGDIMIPIAEGRMSMQNIFGSLGELEIGTVAGRYSEEEITLFDAVGLAVEDLCSAEFIYNKMKEWR